MIYPIISREYFLESPHIEKKEIDNALKTLQEAGVLASKEPESYCKPNRNDDLFNKYLSLCNICEPSLKRFYITMSVLWSQNNLSKEKLQTDCDLIAKELERLEGWPYPEFSDKTKFHNFIELLIAERYVKVDKELLSASKITLKAQDSYKVFFDNRFLEQIQTIN
jgi:glycerol-3-phosphate O-acyltransferase